MGTEWNKNIVITAAAGSQGQRLGHLRGASPVSWEDSYQEVDGSAFTLLLPQDTNPLSACAAKSDLRFLRAGLSWALTVMPVSPSFHPRGRVFSKCPLYRWASYTVKGRVTAQDHRPVTGEPESQRASER